MLDRMLLASASDEKLFVEEVFQTHLYTGTGAVQTITNGVDLAGKGGMVWIKSRSDATDNFLFDTVRGVNVEINSNTSDPNTTLSNSLTAFNSNGFSISSANGIGVNAATYASFTFRKAPKFFDVITYVGNGVSGRSIPHSLGVAPGFIVVKQISGLGASSRCYHRASSGTPTQDIIILENTLGTLPQGSAYWGTSASDFSLYGIYNDANSSGATYVAYLFAHDATADGIIQCGSFTTDGSGNATVNLGWEPQWVMTKFAAQGSSSVTNGGWVIADSMRGLTVSGSNGLVANESSAESAGFNEAVTSTGFTKNFNSSTFGGATFIYIAIRRGPMKTPTVGTSVFSPTAYSGTAAPQLLPAGFPTDMFLDIGRDSAAGTALGGYQWPLFTRLLGNANALETTNTDRWAGGWGDSYLRFDNNLGTQLTTSTAYLNSSGATYISYQFRRAPGFFDVVCYTGTGVIRTVTHNLGVVPTLTIIKRRDTTSDWRVTTNFTGFQYLNDTAAFAPNAEFWGYGTPTSTTIPLGINASINASGGTYVAYLFASCPGVSKVGSYTGNGSSQTINCGFSNGARFVMIKRTDSTGDWYVWDTARGIVNDGLIGSYYANNTTANYGLGVGEYRIYYNSNLGIWRWDAGTFSASSGFGSSTDAVNNLNSVTGWFAQLGSLQSSTGTVDFYAIDRYTSSSYASGEDPRLSLNTTSAEVTSDDAIDPNATGFVVNQTAASNVNVNGATYLYLAIA